MTIVSGRRWIHLVGALLVGLATAPAAAQSYDPLRVPEQEVERIELTVVDGDRDRSIPIAVYLPDSEGPAPVVLFSHGLGGSRHGSAYLGAHWSARGYVCVFLQHPGSDEEVWRDVPPLQRMAALRRAANARAFLDRTRDVSAVLDRLEQWRRGTGPLAGRLDMGRVGLSGHSFGALTTQAVGGQRYGFGFDATDTRIDAALPMSPSSPRAGDPARAFRDVSIPWLLMTGTHDTAIIGNADVASRLAVFPALPPGSKYELVLDGAEHSAFTEHALPGDRNARNPNHHRAILALSTAFWDAYLRGDTAARDWLDGNGARSVLEPGDRWQSK